jgi:NAD(P)-dependent dehydrogenase (short-subunit alcohol dehydrogenase family)
MAGRLQGKVCVITGAGGGMGADAAVRFAEEGAKVTVADVDAESAQQVADQVGGLAVQVDVSDEASVQAMYAAAVEQFGGLDVLYNNAGISPADDASILETDLEAWERVQAVNTRGVYLCCKHGIPHLLERGGGSVINVASFVAIVGAATSQISYTASKGAVLSMTRELAVQFAREGIRVNALCPGPVSTPLLRELFAKDPERAARRLVHVPMGRFGEPEEIAAAVAFLASDDSSFMTAAQFLVDGGITGAYVTPL